MPLLVVYAVFIINHESYNSINDLGVFCIPCKRVLKGDAFLNIEIKLVIKS